MKKLLTFILVLTAILSVSGIALAADVTVTYDVAKTTVENGNILAAAISAAADGDTIIIGAGTYEFDGDYDSRIQNKGITLIGAGQDQTIINSYKYGFLLQGHPDKRVTYNIEDLTINSGNGVAWAHPLYVKGNTEVNLKNVTLHNAGTSTTAILIDSANKNSAGVFEAGIKATVNASNVTADVGNTVEMLANPSTIAGSADILSYAEIEFSDDCTNILAEKSIPQPGYNLGTGNLKVNGEIINSAVAQINGTEYASLQAAIDVAQTMTGDVTITFHVNIDETVTVTQKEGLNLTIDGGGNKMTGTINIHGNSRHTGAETLTIRNIAFEKDSGDAIWANDGEDTVKRYAHNVTIEGCTFTGDAIVGTRIRQGYNISIIDCVMNSGFSLIQNANNTGLTVKNTKVISATEGFNLFASTDVLIDGCDITAEAYGVRVDADKNGDATIVNTKIDAEKPVIVRKVSGSYGLTANTGNAFTVGDGYSPVNIDAGNGTVTYTDNFVAMNEGSNTYYNSMDEAIADAQPGDTVYPVENGVIDQDGAVIIPGTPSAKPRNSITVTYNGGNSFSTSKTDVPTSVEIDGVPVYFEGDGSMFEVGCVAPGAKWITVRWMSTSCTVSFKPDGAIYCTSAPVAFLDDGTYDMRWE